MGADLYIKNLDRKKQYTGFRTDIKVGYFRDAYNSSNLLWQYDLSYWTDIEKFVNKKGDISVAKIKKLIELLNNRKNIFEKNMELLKETGTNPIFDKNRIGEELLFNKKERREEYEWFIKHNKDLFNFLEKAIELNSPIEASL